MEKPTYWSITPAEVRYDKSLTPNAIILFGEISAMTQTTGLCWAGDQYFMNLYNVERQTIQRWLKQLEDSGHIKRIVIFKEGTKQIEKRYIEVVTNLRQGYTQYSDKGIHNIVTDNNTSLLNNTSINIYSHFNLKNIIKHEKMTTKMKAVIKTTLDDYDEETILKAIDNYAYIVHSADYYFDHKWTLHDFLSKGLENFKDLDIAKSNYTRIKNGVKKEHDIPVYQKDEPLSEEERNQLKASIKEMIKKGDNLND